MNSESQCELLDGPKCNTSPHSDFVCQMKKCPKGTKATTKNKKYEVNQQGRNAEKRTYPWRRTKIRKEKNTKETTRFVINGGIFILQAESVKVL